MQPELVLEKLYPDLAKSKKRTKAKSEGNRGQNKSRESMLTIQGINPGVAITMARCCHPLPGEDIVGIFYDWKRGYSASGRLCHSC